MTEQTSTSPDSTQLAGEPVDSPGHGDPPGLQGKSGRDGDFEETSGDPLTLRSQPPPPPVVSEKVENSPSLREADEGGTSDTWWLLLISRQVRSCLISCVFHAALFLTLGLILVASQPRQLGQSLTARITDPEEESFEELDWEFDRSDFNVVIGESVLDRQSPVPTFEIVPEDLPESDTPLGRGIGLEPAYTVEWFPAADAPVGGGLEGRSREGRARLATENGGSPDSEAAVERGLKWLFAHQRDDGSWNFNHHKSACKGMCRNPGTVASTTGATAIALAAFLGAGYTHEGGDYQDTVRRGLYYLVSRALVTPEGVDIQEGTMYAQGLAAIVLCEGYAMTGDPELKDAAQGTIKFIEYAQDKKGGGWRYTPGEPGDTTVTGWQLMALKSGQLANLQVRSPNIFLVSDFLDSVSCEDGAQYGYMSTDPRQTTTAIGLLLRMYTGWRRGNPALAQGVAYLDQWGPSADNMYYNYYASQVMRHWGGPEWERWNPKMRKHLINTQATGGHEAGSWYFSGGHGETGGRLYNTAAAIMTLEVYYRYMPLYKRKAFEPF